LFWTNRENYTWWFMGAMSVGGGYLCWLDTYLVCSLQVQDTSWSGRKEHGRSS
jgi:hypothetical protein